jgi:hypothetical protein
MQRIAGRGQGRMEDSVTGKNALLEMKYAVVCRKLNHSVGFSFLTNVLIAGVLTYLIYSYDKTEPSKWISWN